jgi:hypothetical protein
MKVKFSHFIQVILVIGLCLALAGCGTTHAQKSATGGAALGALAGGLIGGDWSDAVVGAAVGTGLGYMAGNEKDKAVAKQETEAVRTAQAQAQVTSDPSTAYKPPKQSKFAGSTWRILSLVSDDPYPEFSSMVVTFTTDTKLTTLTVLKNGETLTSVESYRVVDDVMIISGKDENGKDYVINAKYSVEGKQMILVAPDMRIVMEEVEERV